MSRSMYLKWEENDFRSKTVNNFKTYLLNEAMVDVTLACEGLTLKAHKIVLSSCSPFFQSVFIEHNCQHPIVVLKDVTYTNLKLIIDFMYNGEIQVREDQIPSLVSTAQCLKVKVLEEVEYDSDPVIDVPDQSSSDNFPSIPPTEQSIADLAGNLWMGSLLHQSEIKRSDSDVEDFNEDMDSGVSPSFTSTVPLETHEQGAGVNFAPNSLKESPSKFMEQTVTTGDELQSSMQSNRELPNTFQAASTTASSGIFDSHQLQNPSATSTVPLQTHNTNSFHESQLEQPNEQGSDENFEPEPDLNESFTSQSKESSVSSLVETLTTRDAHSSQYQSTVKPSVELPHTRSDHYQSTVKSSIGLPHTSSDHSSHYQSTVKSSIGLPRTSSDHSSQYQPTKKSRVEKPHTITSHSSQHQSTVKSNVTFPHTSSDGSCSYRVTLSSSDVLTVQTQQSENSIGSCPKKIIVPKNMDFMRSLEQSSSIRKQELKKKKVRFNEDVQDVVRSSNDVKKTAAIPNEEKKSDDSGSRKVLVKIGTNGTITRTEKFFRCKKCPYKSGFSLSLKKHVNSEHEQSPKFKCDQCSFEASLKENLLRHTAEVHEPVRFACHLCPYKCDQQSHLTRHIEGVHERKKRFRCEVCDFQSSQKASLRKHNMALHEKKKEFACDFCDYSCSRKGNLQRHVKLMHEKKKSGKETKKDDSTSDDQD